MKELQDNLLARIKSNVAVFGFRYKAAERTFIKEAAGAKFAFHISYIKHPSDFDVTVDLAIRYDEVEDFVDALTPHHPLLTGRKVQTWTIGVEVGNLMKGSQARWTVSNDADIESAAASITEIFKDVAQPYFAKYCTAEAAFLMLQRNDTNASLNSPLPAKRWTRVAAFAFLLEPEIVDFWLEKANETLRNANDAQSKEFEDFAKALIARRGSWGPAKKAI